MALTIDLSAASRLVSGEDFRDWAASQTVFLSSVMGELAGERRAVAEALAEADFTVRWFEEFGGRDDPPDVAYLAEVGAADIYLGVLGDEYGAMQPSGFSATHEEYNEARRLGKRVSFWARVEGSERQGNSRSFLQEVRVFNTTGSYEAGGDLATCILQRLREMAAEDLSPWVKLGDVVFRASTITETGQELRIESRVRDQAVLEGLRALAPNPRFGRQQAGAITYGTRSGQGRVTELTVQVRASSSQDVALGLQVEWAHSRTAQAMNYNGIAYPDLIEAGVRVGLLHEEAPAHLAQQMRSFGGMALSSIINDRDPLAELQGIRVAEGSVEPIARALVVEQLVGGGQVASVETLQLGPVVRGRRRVRIGWREYPDAGRPAGSRTIEGERPWSAGS